MTSDETQIQILANWPMSDAKRVTRDNRKNPEYRVVAAIRKLRTDTTVPQENHGQIMLKMSSISNLKRPTAPKILKRTVEHNAMMQRTANEEVVSVRLKRSPRVETRGILVPKVFALMTDHENQSSGVENLVLFAGRKSAELASGATMPLEMLIELW